MREVHGVALVEAACWKSFKTLNLCHELLAQTQTSNASMQQVTTDCSLYLYELMMCWWFKGDSSMCQCKSANVLVWPWVYNVVPLTPPLWETLTRLPCICCTASWCLSDRGVTDIGKPCSKCTTDESMSLRPGITSPESSCCTGQLIIHLLSNTVRPVVIIQPRFRCLLRALLHTRELNKPQTLHNNIHKAI